jgi:hypothetical protein
MFHHNIWSQNHLNRRAFAAVLLAFVLASPFAQENGPRLRSLADLDKEAGKAAALIRAFFVEAGGGSVMGFANMSAGAPVSFTQYWTEEILSSLAGSSSVTAPAGRAAVTVKTEGADYTLSVSTMEIGRIIRIYTRLIRRADSIVATSWTTDLHKTPYLVETFRPVPGVSGVAADPYEPDMKEDPLPLETGGPEIHRSLHQGDEDWFLITVSEGGYIVVETGGNTDTVMEVYGESGLAAENDDGGKESNARTGFMAAPGKSYVVRVHGYEESETGAYSIRAYFSDLPDKDMEPNDSIETAFTIPTDGMLEAFILSKDDEDWYKLTIPAEGGYFFAYTDSAADTWLELLDEAGKKLAEDDDSRGGVNARISLMLPGGVYYLKTGGYESGEYSLTYRLRKPNAEDIYENDDERENAKPIIIGEEQTRTFTTEDDVDWAVLTVAERGAYVITAKGGENKELDTYLSLYAEDSELLEEDDDGGDSYDARIRARLSPGTYYIRAHVLEYPSGSYTLKVSRE